MRQICSQHLVMASQSFKLVYIYAIFFSVLEISSQFSNPLKLQPLILFNFFVRIMLGFALMEVFYQNAALSMVNGNNSSCYISWLGERMDDIFIALIRILKKAQFPDISLRNSLVLLKIQLFFFLFEKWAQQSSQ